MPASLSSHCHPATFPPAVICGSGDWEVQCRVLQLLADEGHRMVDGGASHAPTFEWSVSFGGRISPVVLLDSLAKIGVSHASIKAHSSQLCQPDGSDLPKRTLDTQTSGSGGSAPDEP